MNEEVIWIDVSVKELSKEVSGLGIPCTPYICKQLLKKEKLGLRKMSKTLTLKNVNNRNEQFENISNLITNYKHAGNPIISTDTKKKETIGTFYRDGKCYCNEALKVNDHDFNTFGNGKIVPYGIYDIQKNLGYITLSESKDTSEFACDCIKHWWNNYGKQLYPNATSILILCDGGGSNGSRSNIFKEDLQKIVDEIGIEIRIAHYPPYTSKHNPIEHRLFPHITRSLNGVLINNINTVAEKIEKTTTSNGLKVVVNIFNKVYETGRKATNEFINNCSILFDTFLGNWNYVAIPTNR